MRLSTGPIRSHNLAAAVAVAALAVATTATADTRVYRCTEAGRVLYTDAPCREAAIVELQHDRGAPDAVERLRRDQQMLDDAAAARRARVARDDAERAQRAQAARREALAANVPADPPYPYYSGYAGYGLESAGNRPRVRPRRDAPADGRDPPRREQVVPVPFPVYRRPAR